jgi:hypothetical protein
MTVPQKGLLAKECDPQHDKHTNKIFRSSEILRKMYGITEKDGDAKQRKITRKI